MYAKISILILIGKGDGLFLLMFSCGKENKNRVIIH